MVPCEGNVFKQVVQAVPGIRTIQFLKWAKVIYLTFPMLTVYAISFSKIFLKNVVTLIDRKNILTR